MKRVFTEAVLGLLTLGAAHGQVPVVGKSGSDHWAQTYTKGRPSLRNLAITSVDGKTAMIVEFYPELEGVGMNVSFVDRPHRPCARKTLTAIRNTSLMLNGQPLPGAHKDSFTVGCANEQWIERVVLGSVDANIAIVRALLAADQSVIHLTSADGSFDHSYPVKGFRSLERGGLAAYLHSKGYRIAKSTEQ